jgi:hypothetical protein
MQQRDFERLKVTDILKLRVSYAQMRLIGNWVELAADNPQGSAKG